MQVSTAIEHLETICWDVARAFTPDEIEALTLAIIVLKSQPPQQVELVNLIMGSDWQ